MRGLACTGILVLSLTSGCSTYYTHYGKLTAETADGKVRQGLVTWESGENPGGFGGRDTTPIYLRTQCSERVAVFREAGDPQRSCGGEKPGIFWCGEASGLLQRGGTEAADRGHICGEITDASGSTTISGLGSAIKVRLNCWPARTERGQGDDKINLDLLRASPVPYEFKVRKAPRGSLEIPRPLLSKRGCKE